MYAFAHRVHQTRLDYSWPSQQNARCPETPSRKTPVAHSDERYQEIFVMVKNTALRASTRVSVEDTAKRAYEMYLERGRADGFDREDWLQAERELNAPSHDSYANAPGDGRDTRHA
jgi:hypothetical protein